MTLEATYGVPTVAMHTDKFDRVVRSVAQVNGMPDLAQVFVPQPIMGKSAAELRAYVDGIDPITGRAVMQEVVEGLTRPRDEGRRAIEYDRSTPRLVQPDTEENLHRLFLERNWTDTLPIVLPTEERVAAMLAGTRRKPDEIVGRMRSTHFREYWQYTVEKVAVNAVMAGARSEYFPVILALAASGSTARSSSTTLMTNMAVVNGPIRHQIGMNCGIGALGPYNHANVTIGRAYALLSQNLQGGSVPGETYMGTLGNGLAFSACFAENEERSPWEPLHVQKGFKSTDSAVSVFFGLRYVQEGYGPRLTWREKMRRCLSAGAHFPPLLVMDPIVARLFVERGMDTTQKLIDWLAENARLPAREYWDDQWVQTLLRPLAVAGVEPYASRLKVAPDEIIQMFEPQEINIAVTGGEAQGAWKMFGARYERTVSIDAWR